MTVASTELSSSSSATPFPDSIPPPRYSTAPPPPSAAAAPDQGTVQPPGSSGQVEGGAAAGAPVPPGDAPTAASAEGSTLPNPTPATGYPLYAQGAPPPAFAPTPSPYDARQQHPVGVPPYVAAPGQHPAPGAYPGVYPGVRYSPPAGTRVKVTREGGVVTVAVPGAGWGPYGQGASAGSELLSAVVLIVLGSIFPILLVVFPVFFLALFCIPFLILGILALASSFRTALLKEELSLRDGRFGVSKDFLGWKKKVEGPVTSIAFIFIRLKQRHSNDSTGTYRPAPPKSVIIVQQGLQEHVFGEFLSYAEHEFIVSELAASGLAARPPQWETYIIY